MILTLSCYFSVVSVMLWTTAQTPMQCDRTVLLRFPNQVSSPPPFLSPLFSGFTKNECFGRDLCAKALFMLDFGQQPLVSALLSTMGWLLQSS